MSYSESFPTQRPIFSLDAANAGRLDPRCSFSRADTPPTYAAPSAVHYWSNEKHLSSENLLLQSSDFDTSWSADNLSDRNSGQADPSGGTDGFELVESTANSWHRVYQSVTATGDITAVVYAKQNSGTRYLMMTMGGGGNNLYECATFDLAGGTPNILHGSSSSFTSVSATQTASGSGYYKCVLKATGTCSSLNVSVTNTTATPAGNPYGLQVYTGDGSSSIDVAFASLSTTGATDYNATTTSIHRQYASSLKSVSYAGQPRFEYDPASDGQSMGILIEGQSTNLLNYSEQFDNGYWYKDRTTVTANSAIAPNGELAADLITANQTGASNTHNLSKSGYAFTSGTTYTYSVFVKAAGFSSVDIGGGNPATYPALATFTLTGAGTASSTHGSSSIQSCGNGWYRCVVTGTAAASAATNLNVTLRDSSGTSFDGDDYSGVLIWGANLTQSSHAYSYLKAEGSATTKAAESLSMTDSSLFDNGGGTLYAEASQNVLDTYNGVFAVSDGTGANTIEILGNSSSFRGQVVNANSTNASFIGGTITVGQFNKHALTFSSSEASYYVNGSEIGTTDSSVVIPTVSEIDIGNVAWSRPLNGHVRKVALYSEPISETAAAAITS